MRAKELLLRVGLAERVAEETRQTFERAIVGKDIKRSPAKRVEPPHIVQPHDVIGVGVREHDRVDAIDLVGDALKAQLRRGIDQDARFAVGDDD